MIGFAVEVQLWAGEGNGSFVPAILSLDTESGEGESAVADLRIPGYDPILNCDPEDLEAAASELATQYRAWKRDRGEA